MLIYSKWESINTHLRIFDYAGTLLHYAAADGNKEAITTLLRQGADIMLEDSLQHLPLEEAIDKNNSKILLM
jgi:ankyrin repeat protein